ncbi:MAG: metallophosphoesterase family protein [Acidobacteriaceae bacterium]|nr:metallophosphoesterase family protein [Acidobacteriaceae bacterium]
MRILVLSDIHSNLEALEACLAAAPAHDIVVNLGDTVGYCASPNEVIDLSRRLGKVFVRGNHDKAACGLIELNDFNPVAALAAEWTRQQLTAENLEWLRKLPQGPVQVDGLTDLQFVHGSPIDEDEYLITVRDAVEPIMGSMVSVTFFGHTHLQGSFVANANHLDAFRPIYKTVGQAETAEVGLKKGNRVLVNPGSVGQPRDGDWRAGFAVFDSDARILTFCRVPYDLKSAQDRIFAAELPTRLATRLAAGR